MPGQTRPPWTRCAQCSRELPTCTAPSAHTVACGICPFSPAVGSRSDLHQVGPPTLHQPSVGFESATALPGGRGAREGGQGPLLGLVIAGPPPRHLLVTWLFSGVPWSPDLQQGNPGPFWAGPQLQQLNLNVSSPLGTTGWSLVWSVGITYCINGPVRSHRGLVICGDGSYNYQDGPWSSRLPSACVSSDGANW